MKMIGLNQVKSLTMLSVGNKNLSKICYADCAVCKVTFIKKLKIFSKLEILMCRQKFQLYENCKEGELIIDSFGIDSERIDVI